MAAHGRRTLGVGLVGVGWMGRMHSEAYARAPFHFSDHATTPRFVIAADAAVEQQHSARNLGYEAFTCDWREVVGHPDVEAVSITAPNDLHRDVAVCAAKAGKHIWIEKPVGRSLSETAEIATAIARAGVSCMVGLDLRFVPVLLHARELTAGGHVGDVTAARGVILSDFGNRPGSRSGWRFDRERAGYGVVGDLMVHVLDLLSFIVGPVSEVFSAAGTLGVPVATKVDHGNGGVTNEDHAVSLLRFACGALGTAESSRVAVGHHSDISLEVQGTRGAISWRFDRMNELTVHPGATSGDDVGATTVVADQRHGAFAAFQPGPGLPMGYDDLKVIEAHEFCRAIATGNRCEPGIEEALANARVLAAIVRSWRSGRWEAVEQ